MTTRREDPLQMLHSSDSVSWTRILGTAKTEWTEEKAEAELANIVAGTEAREQPGENFIDCLR